MTAPLIPVLCEGCGRPYFRTHTCPAASRGFEVVPDAPEARHAPEMAATELRSLPGGETSTGANLAQSAATVDATGESFPPSRAAWRRLITERDDYHAAILRIGCDAARATGREGPRPGEASAAWTEALVADLCARLRVERAMLDAATHLAGLLKTSLREAARERETALRERDRALRRAVRGKGGRD